MSEDMGRTNWCRQCEVLSKEVACLTVEIERLSRRCAVCIHHDEYEDLLDNTGMVNHTCDIHGQDIYCPPDGLCDLLPGQGFEAMEAT